MEKPLLTPALAPPRGAFSFSRAWKRRVGIWLAGNLRVSDDVGRSGFLILGEKLTRLLVGRLLTTALDEGSSVLFDTSFGTNPNQQRKTLVNELGSG